MSEDGTHPSIPWEQVAAGAAALSGERRLAGMAARFLALVDSWASPSAVLCALRDPASPEGARMVPELTSGSVTSAAERALARLFTDYPPGMLTRPTLVKPPEESTAFKVRDSLVVPWAHGAEHSGFLVLRGLPRPEPPNLGDAVALLAQPLWSRVAARLDAQEPGTRTAADGVEDRLRELRRLVEELEAQLRAEAASDREAGEAREASEAAAKAAQEAKQERDKASADRDAARAEADELKGRLEALQGKLESEGSRVAELLARASEAETARDGALAKLEAAEKAAAERPAQPEAAAATASGTLGGDSIKALRSAVEALRRTPFVPPTVRVLFGEAEGHLQVSPAAGSRSGRILLLDRDASMLGALAGELEREGLEVLIAHYADEVSLFLKTPEARELSALVLDVLALRPDQNVVELVRAWRRDLPNLAVYLTFRADNPTEAERAQRLPSSTTAGYIPRPLKKEALLDAVTSQARRGVKR
jgi:hypothetical protein